MNNEMPDPIAAAPTPESLLPKESMEDMVNQAEEEIQAPILEKPKMNDPNESDNMVATPKLAPRGIEVVATRKGFYNQNRIGKGEQFKIRSFDDVGEWMECVDPALEKKRVEKFKKKKAKEY